MLCNYFTTCISGPFCQPMTHSYDMLHVDPGSFTFDMISIIHMWHNISTHSGACISYKFPDAIFRLDHVGLLTESKSLLHRHEMALKNEQQCVHVVHTLRTLSSSSDTCVLFTFACAYYGVTNVLRCNACALKHVCYTHVVYVSHTSPSPLFFAVSFFCAHL